MYSFLELRRQLDFFDPIPISSLNPHGYPPPMKDTSEKHPKLPHCTEAGKDQNHVQLVMTSTKFKFHF